MTTVAKWQFAHPDITVTDAMLKTMAPFPSLAITDFIAYLQSRGVEDDIISFLRDICREIHWTYDCWSKEQRDRQGVKLLDDLVRNVPKMSEHADFMFRFIRDYRDANNLNWKKPEEQRAWEAAMTVPIETVGDANASGVVGGV